MAASTLHSPMMAPRETSTPAVRITSICPQEIRARKQAWRSTVMPLFRVRNRGLMIPSITMTAIRTKKRNPRFFEM
jgi:hypothetical protein